MQMIEDHYSHITPLGNAERILQGLPGWEPASTAPQAVAETGRVNAAAAETKPDKPKAKKAGAFKFSRKGRVHASSVDAPA